ncbi:MAG: DUF2066 domain-containing protein [Alphaproteobacteria bacterium]
MNSACSGANILDLRWFATPARSAAQRVVATLLFALVLAPWIAARAAPDSNVFTILDVRVDTTDKTAAAARKIALAEGHRQAFDRLLTRLVPDRERSRVPRITAADIAELIRDFQIDSEKTSPVRYLATLRFRFKRAAVRRHLRDSGVPFAETRSKPVLVMPLYRRAGALLLWDRANGWREAWGALPPSDGLIPMILPKGVLEDVNDIGPEQALKGDETRLRAIARRYGATDVLMVVARLGTDRSANTFVLHVTVDRLGASGQGKTIVRSFAATPGEPVRALLDRAAGEISNQVEESWKHDNLLRFGDTRWLTAVTELRGLGDWVTVRSRLVEIAFVQASELMSLSRKVATVRLSFIGDEEQLILALAQRDLTLSRGPATWMLKIGAAVTR